MILGGAAVQQRQAIGLELDAARARAEGEFDIHVTERTLHDRIQASLRRADG